MSSNNSNHWQQIKCPFFHNDNFNSIVCEGFFADSSVRHTFATTKAKWHWEREYCYKIHECALCPIYNLANEKYEE